MAQGSSDLLQRFEAHFLERGFLRERQRILIACSGGPDSVALFHLLRALAPRYHWALALAHFNHRLRGRDAFRDERFVRELARAYRTPFFGGTGNVLREAEKTKSSVEEAARCMRYDFFLRVAKKQKFRIVALAHTQDDQAETVLMRILQGTGLRGLQGIRERFKKNGVSWLRPLLSFSKQTLADYLSRERIRFRRDRSNEELRFVRNRIRLKLMPQLRRDFNPKVIEALARVPSIVAWESALIAELEEKAWRKAFKKKHRKEIELHREAFLKFPPALQFRIIEKALKQLDRYSGLSFEAWERIRRGIVRSRYGCSLPKDIDLALTPKKITLYKKHSRSR